MLPPPGRRRTRCRSRAAWMEGNKGNRSDQIHCGGGARSGTRRGCGKIVAYEDFASFLIYVSVRSSFPRWFFSFFCTAWYMCYIFNSWVAGSIHLATATWGVNLIAKALRSFRSRMIKRGGVMLETQQWGGCRGCSYPQPVPVLLKS